MRSQAIKRSSSEQRSKIIDQLNQEGAVVNRYLKGKFLGKGGYARCYEFTNLSTRHTTACKIIPKSSFLNPRVKQKLMFEIKIHRSIKHPHIVNFEHQFEDPLNVYILLEYCENQTLADLLRRRIRLSETEAQSYAVQLIAALQFLHSKNIIHRDVKLGNLLLNRKMELKLGDFGFATKLEFRGERRRTVCGTPNYIAPEIIEGDNGHSFEVDVWSLGVVIYTLLVGRPPFETQDIKTTYGLIRQNQFEIPEYISEPARELISLILVKDPAARIDLNGVLEHSFFKGGPVILSASSLACPVPKSAGWMGHTPDREETKSQERQTPTKNLEKVASDGPRRGRTPARNEPAKDSARRMPVCEGSCFYDGVGPQVWVRAWVDYSSHYGIGYLLSSGSVGVLYNDSTKALARIGSEQFWYLDKSGGGFHAQGRPPAELVKKVKLLRLFQSQLEGLHRDAHAADSGVYVKKWQRGRHAIVFRLSNKTSQVSFLDSSQIVISEKEVTYIDVNRSKQRFTMAEALESGDSEMKKRLSYTRGLLSGLEKRMELA